MAHAALRRPKMLGSWSCIGPRRRPNAIHSDEQDPSPEPTEVGISEPLFTSPRDSGPTEDLPVSSSDVCEWDSGAAGCSYSNERNIHHELDVDVADGEGLTEEHHGNEDHLMTEVELWHQLEHELYDRGEGEEADVENEIREEEEAAMQEVGASKQEGLSPVVKEAHRFFPPGKIMHIINLLEKEDDDEEEEEEDDDEQRSSGASSSSLSEGVDRRSSELKVGIFLTPRASYSKLRLSHSMISDHFMPVYRRQIEKLIRELEKELQPEPEKELD